MTGTTETTEEKRTFRPVMFVFGLVVFLFAVSCGALMLSDLRGSIWAGLAFFAIILAFAAAGVFVMKLAWKIPELERQQRLRKARYPDQPWRWREDWEQGFAMAENFAKGRFRFDTQPGLTGRSLRGRLETDGQVPAGSQVEFALECASWRPWSRVGVVTMNWQGKTSATTDSLGCDVDLPIPAELPESWTVERDHREIYWRLIAKSESGYHALFTVPVFKG
jgi:hypothetical protein